MAMQHCDVLLAIGARFDDRVIGNPAHFFEHAQDHPYRYRSFIDLETRAVDVPVSAIAGGAAGAHQAAAGGKEKPDQAALKNWWAQIKEVARTASVQIRPFEHSHQAPVRDRSSMKSPRAMRS